MRAAGLIRRSQKSLLFFSSGFVSDRQSAGSCGDRLITDGTACSLFHCPFSSFGGTDGFNALRKQSEYQLGEIHIYSFFLNRLILNHDDCYYYYYYFYHHNFSQYKTFCSVQHKMKLRLQFNPICAEYMCLIIILLLQPL